MVSLPKVAARSVPTIGFVALMVYGFLSSIFMQNSLIDRNEKDTRLPTMVSNPDISAPLSFGPKCPVNPDAVLRPFGSFKQIPGKACGIDTTTDSLDLDFAKDVIGYRLPFYAFDPTRTYRCLTATLAATNVLAARNLKIDQEIFEKSEKNCTLTGSHQATLEVFMQRLGPTVNHEEAQLELRQFLMQEDRGKMAIEAVRKVAALQDLRVNRDFDLIKEEEAWRSWLPSEKGQAVFGDVNTYTTELPPTIRQTMFLQNARIEKNGRIATENMEIFYPKRAPYSHVALMESMKGGRMDQFEPNLVSRRKMLETLRADLPQRQKCLATVRAHEKVSCGFSDVAVNKVLVTSQNLGSQMFHFMCENLPRLGAYLNMLRNDPSIYLHVACPDAAGYCSSLLELLGINRTRLVRGPPLVLAKTAIVPEGGRRHWPLGNAWGLLALRDAITSQYFAHEKDPDFSMLPETGPGLSPISIRVLVIKRSVTRLAMVTSKWYDVIAGRLRGDRSFAYNFPRIKLNVTMFDDKEKGLMSQALPQIKEMRESDIIIGAHGAALSWINYARPRSHFISFRARSNSDIYEHLSLLGGIGFHHILFTLDADRLYSEIRHSVGNSIVELLKTNKVRQRNRAMVVLGCYKCPIETLEKYASRVNLVISFGNTEAKRISKTNILLINDDPISRAGIFCAQEVKLMLLDNLRGFLGNIRTHVYFGLVVGGHVELHPNFDTLWAQMDQYHAMFFVDNEHTSLPSAMFFHANMNDEMCFGESQESVINREFNMMAVAVVVSTSLIHGQSSDSRIFHLLKSPEQQAKIARYVALQDSKGSYALLEGDDIQIAKDSGFFLMLRIPDQNAWEYRGFPLTTIMRQFPSAETLGSYGRNLAVEVPVGDSTTLRCRVNAANLQQMLDGDVLSDTC